MSIAIKYRRQSETVLGSIVDAQELTERAFGLIDSRPDGQEFIEDTTGDTSSTASGSISDASSTISLIPNHVPITDTELH